MGNGANGGQIAKLIQSTPQLAQQLGQVPNGGLGTLAKTAVMPLAPLPQTDNMFGGSGTAYPAGGLPTPKAKGGQNFSGGTPTPGGMPIENGFNNNVPADQPMGGFGGQMGGFGGQMGGNPMQMYPGRFGGQMGGFGGQKGGNPMEDGFFNRGGQMGGQMGSQMYAPPPAPMGMGNPMSAPNQNAAPPMGGVANILGGMGMMNQ